MNILTIPKSVSLISSISWKELWSGGALLVKPNIVFDSLLVFPEMNVEKR